MTLISPQEAFVQHQSEMNGLAANQDPFAVDPDNHNRILGVGLGLTMLAGGVINAANHEVKPVQTEQTTEHFRATPFSTEDIPADAIGGLVGKGELSDAQVAENFARSSGEMLPGFKPGEVVFGSNVDLTKHTEDRGVHAFSQEGVYSPEEIKAFLNGNSEQSKAAQKHIIESNLSSTEKERALNGEGYIITQILAPANIHGTTYVVDGEVRRANERAVQSGDVVFLFADVDGNVSKEASIRADCVNPNIEEIVPQTPGREVPPVSETPPTSEVPPTTDTTTTTEETTPPTSNTTSSSTSSTTSTSSTSSTTTIAPSTTTTTTRPEVTVPAPPPIGGPGDPGNPDEDDDPDNNTTTSTTIAPSTTTIPGTSIPVTIPGNTTTVPTAPYEG